VDKGGVCAVVADGSDAEASGAALPLDDVVAVAPADALEGAVPVDEVVTSAPARAAHEASAIEAIIIATVAAPRIHRFSACIPCLPKGRQLTVP
jgi:hypothetical protein